MAAPPRGAARVPPQAPAPPTPSVGGAVVICCLVNLNEAVSANIIWPLLPFLVGRYAHPADVGFYVGLLGSSYFLGQTLTVRSWGSLSDRYGRRPILLVGLLGSLLSSLWFGLAQTYIEAIASRFLCGILNGNIAIAKVYVGEVTTQATQSTGFALLSLTWGLGTLFAPALGGFLADPAALYPGSALDTPLLRHYPFLLPSLISVAFSILCLLLALPLLKETQQWQRRQQQQQPQQQHQAVPTAEPAEGEEGEESAAGTGLEGMEAEGGGALDEEVVELDEEEERTAAAAARELEDEGDSVPLTSRGAAALPTTAPLADDVEGTPSKSKHAAAGGSGGGGGGGGPALPPAAITAASSSLSIALDPTLGPAIAAYASLCALQILFDELMPVFCSTAPEVGGLGWRSSTIGSIQIFAGCTQVLSTIAIVPVLQRRMGIKRSFLVFFFPMVPFFLLFPLVARLAPWPEAMYAAMCCAVAARTLLFSLPFSSIMIVLNNVAPAAHLGLVVSVAQAVASGIRTLGPTLGGGLFSASMAAEALGQWRLLGPYLLMAGIAGLTLALGTRISALCEAPPG